jgi:CubicO group peptidase (beta-lactamase class C family)
MPPFDRTRAAIEAGIAEGLHTGAQVYVSRDKQILFDDGIGTARPHLPMTRQTIALWMSSVKPIVAIAIAMLFERRKLDLDDRVAKFIPEFAQNGKDAITIRHVLTHTGGFRAAAGNWTRDPWDLTIAKICASKTEPRWVPGEKAGYHVASGWFILGELIRRIDGRMFNQFVREEIFIPLGMNDSWIGMPHDAFERYGDRIAIYYATAKGPPDLNQPGPTAEDAGMLRPGGNGRGPIRELGRFYEMLLNGGQQILKPKTVKTFISPQRVGMLDETFKAVIDWGLGFIVNSQGTTRLGSSQAGGSIPYGYGPYASRLAFGHSGFESSCAFCDPEYDLVIAWTCNGFAGDARHQIRQQTINSAIYQDLNLATTRDGGHKGVTSHYDRS